MGHMRRPEIKERLLMHQHRIEVRIKSRSQHSSSIADWLSVAGDRCSNPGGGENFPLSFLSHDLLIAINLQINSRLCKVIYS